MGYGKLIDWQFSADITVLGGLPVRVVFTAHDDGAPDGWMIDSIDEYRSVKTNKPLGKWVERRIAEAGEDDKIHRSIWEADWSDETYVPEEHDPRSPGWTR